MRRLLLFSNSTNHESGYLDHGIESIQLFLGPIKSLVFISAATVGLVSSTLQDKSILELLAHVQHDLFDLGAELSQPGKSLISQDYVDYLEQQASDLNDSLPPLKEFILPGGSTMLGFIHLARTVCRRVERHCVALNQQQAINPSSLKYLNRLSDLLFILARFMAKTSGQKEVYWQSQFSRLKSD